MNRHQPLLLFRMFLILMDKSGSDFEGYHNYIVDHYKLMSEDNQGLFHQLVSEHMKS